MTAEEQIDAIGECLPDLVEKVATGLWFYRANVSPSQKRFDPFRDLNAVHDAENLIGDSIWESYRDALCGVCATDCAAENRRSNQWWRAKAGQRLEALVKTLELWKDDK